MAALVIVLAFFFMPGNDNSETMLMRVRVTGVRGRPCYFLPGIPKLSSACGEITVISRRHKPCSW